MNKNESLVEIAKDASRNIEKHIDKRPNRLTINILPDNPAAWFWIAIAVCFHGCWSSDKIRAQRNQVEVKGNTIITTK